ncbi:hypothetical protein K438DRAFT_839559 [Mycena galopus ATCC 62051]|nr:hypothetical protein K438DRAFT_839559 [Mycena galopus ATCC 62051]
MILKRGLGRASFIWGSSTNNTRIERLWVEVGSQFARRWRAFFYRLEALHGLDRSNPRHLWLLHFLFLDRINADCETFRAEWNCHPISGKGHDQSPECKTECMWMNVRVYTQTSSSDTTEPMARSAVARLEKLALASSMMKKFPLHLAPPTVIRKMPIA